MSIFRWVNWLHVHISPIADKHSDKLSKMMPVGTVQPMSHLQAPAQDTTSLSSLPVSESEDDQQGKGNNSWLNLCIFWNFAYTA